MQRLVSVRRLYSEFIFSVEKKQRLRCPRLGVTNLFVLKSKSVLKFKQ
jgi:hypothetical protein